MRVVSFLSGRMVAWTSNGQKAIEQDANRRMIVDDLDVDRVSDSHDGIIPFAG